MRAPKFFLDFFEIKQRNPVGLNEGQQRQCAICKDREAVLFVLSIENMEYSVYNEIDSWSLIGNLCSDKRCNKVALLHHRENNLRGTLHEIMEKQAVALSLAVLMALPGCQTPRSWDQRLGHLTLPAQQVEAAATDPTHIYEEVGRASS